MMSGYLVKASVVTQGTALYYHTGQRVDGDVTVIPVENPANKTKTTFTDGAWSIDFNKTNDVQYLTFIIDDNEKIGYTQIKLATENPSMSRLNCTTQNISLSGYSVDINSGDPITSGDVKVSVLDTDYANTTSFSGIWDIDFHPCLIPGKIYTLQILVSGLTYGYGEQTTIYDFSGITKPSSTHKATEESSSTDPGLDEGTEALTSDYQDIDASDNNRWDYVSGTYERAYQQFRFIISEDIDSIVELKILHEGSALGYVGTECVDYPPDYGIYLYLWNFSGSYWKFEGLHFSDDDQTITRTYTNPDEINDFINQTGYLYIQVKSVTADAGCTCHIYTDFVKAEVTSTSNLVPEYKRGEILQKYPAR